MTSTTISKAQSSEPLAARLELVDGYRRLQYRALVLQAAGTDLPRVWEATPAAARLTSAALWCGCVGLDPLPCWDPCSCLAVALWLDLPDAWAGETSRADRQAMFAQLEQVAAGLDPWIAAAAMMARPAPILDTVGSDVPA